MNCPECGADNCCDLDCDECDGSGVVGPEEEYCEACNGDGFQANWYECDKCGETFEA